MQGLWLESGVLISVYMRIIEIILWEGELLALIQEWGR